jgi:DmsE family decaheme c-type cytochrome
MMGGATMTFSRELGSMRRRGNARKSRNVAAIAVCLLGSLLIFAPRSSLAGEFNARGDSFAALRELAEARQIPAAEQSNGFASARFGTRPDGGAGDDRAYIDLRDFAERIGTDAPPVVLAKGEKAKTVIKAEGEATFVGSQVCLGCHVSQAAAFNQTLMGRVFRNPRNAQERANCETCHGPGSLHVKAGGGRGVGGIISFRADDTSRTVDQNNAICLTCHERGDRTYWKGSPHEKRDVACGDCHQVMQRVSTKFQLAKGTELETCFQCHKDKRSQALRSAHMPLREGKMTCSDCHNPHGSATDALLKEVSINDVCYKCHAEKRGPFLYDHPPVRENCLNCHNPHGTNNAFMLNVARPRLCQQCHTLGGHAQPGNPWSRFMIANSCQNCHSQIHGSNNPSGARFQR